MSIRNYTLMMRRMLVLLGIGIICSCFAWMYESGFSELNDLVVTKQDSIESLLANSRAYDSIAEFKKNIQSGDVITRTGNDFTSESLRKLQQRNKTYSHCGIASIENDSLFVYHAMGGEWNPDEKLRRDPIEIFAAPEYNRGIGIFHFKIADSTRKQLILIAQEQYKKNLMFDMHFDLNTDDRMYCAEFVYKAFLKASHNYMRFNISRINQFKFVGVDDIFLHPLCRIKKSVVYK